MVKQYGPEKTISKKLDLDDTAPAMTPISSITSKLVTEQSTAITDRAWQLYIGILLFQLVMADNSASLSRDPHAVNLLNQLKKAGLVGADYAAVLRTVRENRTSFGIGKLVRHEVSSASSEEFSVNALGESLVSLVCDAKSDCHYLLAIDGLDKIISDNSTYWLTLAALIRTADKIHSRLISTDIDVKLLVMCRSDVFRRIEFADADKILGDSTLYADWSAHETDAKDSHLWDYFAQNAQIEPDQLFAFFPERVVVGLRSEQSRSFPTLNYLLDSTRRTPREMTSLMKRLQEVVGGHGSSIRSDAIRPAVDRFATQDLITVVKSEATGTLEKELRTNLEAILSALPSAVGLTPRDLAQACKTSGIVGADSRRLTEFLFLAGLLGAFDPNSKYVQYIHRRDTTRFKPCGPWALHRAIAYAFNVPFTHRR